MRTEFPTTLCYNAGRQSGTVVLVVVSSGGGGGFCLACEDLGEKFAESFPACPFFSPLGEEQLARLLHSSGKEGISPQ